MTRLVTLLQEMIVSRCKAFPPGEAFWTLPRQYYKR